MKNVFKQLSSFFFLYTFYKNSKKNGVLYGYIDFFS